MKFWTNLFNDWKNASIICYFVAVYLLFEAVQTSILNYRGKYIEISELIYVTYQILNRSNYISDFCPLVIWCLCSSNLIVKLKIQIMITYVLLLCVCVFV